MFTGVLQNLWIHACVSINNGKTKVWNAAGHKPTVCEVLDRVAQANDPDANVWRESEVATERQGLLAPLIALVPMMFLSRLKGTGTVGRDELATRGDWFSQGRWRKLVESALKMEAPMPRKREVLTEAERHGRAAQDRVQQWQVSRARQEFVGSVLAPKTQETLTELRSRRHQTQLREIPEEVMQFVPEVLLQLNMKIFAFCFRTGPAGSAPGPGGLHEQNVAETLLLLGLAACRTRDSATQRDALFHNGHADCLAEERRRSARDRHRHHIPRLVAKSVAKQFSEDVEAACAPFQFALSTRAGGIAWVMQCSPKYHRNGPARCSSPIDGVGARPRVPKFHFEEVQGGSCAPANVAFCACCVFLESVLVAG